MQSNRKRTGQQDRWGYPGEQEQYNPMIPIFCRILSTDGLALGVKCLLVPPPWPESGCSVGGEVTFDWGAEYSSMYMHPSAECVGGPIIILRLHIVFLSVDEEYSGGCTLISGIVGHVLH